MPEFSKTVSFWRGALPHWEVVDGRYFVTLRLSNSVPRATEYELRTELESATQQDCLVRSRLYFQQLETWLDKCRMSEGILSLPDIAKQIEATILAYDEIGYWRMLAYVVMPNHLHLFFRCESLGLKAVMMRFKRATAHFVNKHLEQPLNPLWQEEWFDHWSRSPQEDDKIVSYIINNPVKAGLVSDPRDWAWLRAD
jgi:REP element-mobilizing transposase RayT